MFERTHPDVFFNLSILKTFFKCTHIWMTFGLLLWLMCTYPLNLLKIFSGKIYWGTNQCECFHFSLYSTWSEEIAHLLSQGLFKTIILSGVAVSFDVAKLRGTVRGRGCRNHTDFRSFMALMWLILNCCNHNFSSDIWSLCVYFPF